MHKPLLIALMLLALAGAAWLFSSGESSTPLDPLEDPVAARDSKGPQLVGSGRTPSQEQRGNRRVPGGALQLGGRVLRGREQVAARVEAWWKKPTDGLGTYVKLLLRDADWQRDVGAAETFLFTDLADGQILLRATTADGSQGFGVWPIKAGAEPGTIELHVADGPHPLDLRITYTDGRPFRGHVVLGLENGPNGSAVNGWWSGNPPQQTDEEGRVRFEGLHPTKARPVALALGELAYHFGPLIVPQTQPYDLVIRLGERRLRGRVLGGDDEPIANALVKIRHRGGSDTPFDRWATSGPDGRFDSEAAVGPLSLFVTAPGRVRLVQHFENEANDVTLRMQRTCQLSGRVLDEAGKPVAGVSVIGRTDLTRFLFHLKPSITAMSAKDGSYALRDAPPGEVTVFAFGNGWISRDLREMDDHSDYNPLAITLDGGEARSHDLIVRRSGSLEGIVRDEAGQPVAGARMQCSEIGKGAYFSHRIIEYAFGFVPAPPPVKTDKEGRYVIPSLVSNTDYSLEALHELGEASASVSVRAGERVKTDLRLALREVVDIPEWAIHVRVLDAETGAPLEGAEVQGYGTHQTNASGEAELLVENSENVNVSVTAGGYFSDNESLSRTEDLEEGSTIARVEMRLMEAAEISGVIFYPDGTPAASVETFLGGGASNLSRHHRDWSNADGTFRIGRLKTSDERKTLSAQTFHDGTRYEAQIQVFPGETGLKINLEAKESNEALRHRSVQVVGSAGQPAGSARVKLHTARPNEYMNGKLFLTDRSFSVQDGTLKIELEHLPFWIEIHKARDNRGNPLGTLLVGPFEDTAKVPDPLTLAPAKGIEGIVKDERGRPVVGLQITATALHESFGEFGKRQTEHATARSNRDGHFRFRDLGGHMYQVSVATPARWRAPKAQETLAGKASLAFTLQETLGSVITVVNEKGDPLPRCTVQVHEGDELPHFRLRAGIQGETFADGRATLLGLDPEETYLLEVTPPYGDKLVLKASIPEWTPVAEQTVVLASGMVVAGAVVDEGGRSCPKASISLSYPDGNRAGHAVADEAGAFRFEGLKRGRLVATIRNGPFTPESTHEVDVPSTGLELVHPMGSTLVLAPKNAPEGPFAWRIQGIDRREKAGYFSGTGTWKGPLEIRGLVADATYTLWVFFPDEQRLFYGTSIGGKTGTLRPRLEPALTLAGRIVLSDGKALSEGAAIKLRAPGLYLEGSADTSGAFELQGIPPGTWETSASAWRDLIQYQGSARGVAGKPFDLVLKRND